MRRTRPSNHELAWLARQRLTRQEVAERFGVHEATVGRWCRDAGIKWPHRKHRLVDYGNERVTLSEGARRAGINPSLVQWRYERGVRGKDLWAPPSRSHSRKPASHYELEFDRNDWDTVLAVYQEQIKRFDGDRGRAKRATASKFGIPPGAIGAAENKAWHRLG